MLQAVQPRSRQKLPRCINAPQRRHWQQDSISQRTWQDQTSVGRIPRSISRRVYAIGRPKVGSPIPSINNEIRVVRTLVAVRRYSSKQDQSSDNKVVAIIAIDWLVEIIFGIGLGLYVLYHYWSYWKQYRKPERDAPI